MRTNTNLPFRLLELDNELDTLKKQVSDLYPYQLINKKKMHHCV